VTAAARSAALLLLLLLVPLVPLALPLAAGELRSGAAAVRITPPVGVPMAGYYFARAAASVHDHLYAKAIVLEADGTRAALVALDLITTHRWLVEEARSAIEERTGIPAKHVMVSATHAHTGPVLVDGSRRTAALGGESDPAVAYSKALPALVAEAVWEAASRMAPAEILAARGSEETLAFNRRYHMTDGTVGWNPGKLNPRILRPAGPIDPEVPVFFFRAGEKPFAVHVSYAMHLDTVGGLAISADYPFALGEVLARVLGHDLLTVFTTGCAGDLNHIDVGWEARQKGHDEAERIGCILAGAVLETLPRLEALPGGKLQCRSAIVELPLPEVSAGEVEEARRTVERRQGGEEIPFLETVRAFRTLDVAARAGKPLEVEVQAITLGTDAAWVALPGEIFVELGLAIKRASPFAYTTIAELANGSAGYVPTRHAYTQGNYEVVSARCAAGSGEILVEAACSLLGEAHREAAAGAERAAAEER
jgi:hypothetical protein